MRGTPDEFGGQSPYDVLRRKYLRNLNKLTGRAVIVYSTAWTENKPNVRPETLIIDLGDVEGLMEAVSNVEERELDLILHSPGGSPEAAESIVEYLRSRFDHIRAVVPVAAMSAATMIALSADEIVMGAHSQLGPIDPQFTVMTPEGPRSAPAQAIKDQFEMAKEQCRDPANLAAWLPILRQYGPGLLAQCDHQRELGQELVGRWLERYMFAGNEEAQARATAVAAWFSDFAAFRSHGRRVSRELAREQGLTVTDLEADDKYQDAVLSIHHALRHTFAGTGAAKVIENHRGRAFIEMIQFIIQQQVNPGGQPAQPPQLAPPASSPRPRKGGRRR